MSLSPLEIWLQESRKKMGAILDPWGVIGTTVAGSQANLAKKPTAQHAVVTVLVPEVKAMPVPIVPTELAPASVIPPVVQAPTMVLVGDVLGGGYRIPWSNGPAALMNEEWSLGSLLFYMGNRLAVSIGIYDKGESMRDLIISKYLTNAKLRVHTGVGRASNAGRQSRDDLPDEVRPPGPLVPYGGSAPPKDLGDVLEQFEDVARGMENPWMRRAPGMSPVDKFKANLNDLLKFLRPWEAEPGTWLQ